MTFRLLTRLPCSNRNAFVNILILHCVSDRLTRTHLCCLLIHAATGCRFIWRLKTFKSRHCWLDEGGKKKESPTGSVRYRATACTSWTRWSSRHSRLYHGILSSSSASFVDQLLTLERACNGVLVRMFAWIYEAVNLFRWLLIDWLLRKKARRERER